MNLTEHNIRQAAIRLISRNGFESMTLRQLSKEAGVNSSALYLYYKGKSELLLTLVSSYLEDVSVAWDKHQPHAASADVLLRSFVAFHVEFHLLRREEAVLSTMELRSLDRAERVIVKLARRRQIAKLQNILERGNREGSMQCDEPKLLARTLYMTLTHPCAWYQADGRLSVAEVTDHYCDLALRMVGYTLPSAFPPPAKPGHRALACVQPGQ